VTFLPEHLKKMDDVLSIFEKLDVTNYSEYGDIIGPIKPAVVFIDEIHNIKLPVQEWLGVAMENFEIESSDGKVYWVPYFTLVGATTNDGLLSKPFLDRFKMRFIFRPYSFDESVEIVLVHAARLNQRITHEATEEISKRGRGVPRILVGYLERCRDTSIVNRTGIITQEVALNTFDLLGIDSIGLRETELRLMKVLYEVNAPVGVENLSIIINEAPKTIVSSIEPFLIQNGFVIRSGQGRILTQKGREYLEVSGSKKIVRKPLPPGYVRRAYAAGKVS
jgi:Holliday junction DNA helicase RuvB